MFCFFCHVSLDFVLFIGDADINEKPVEPIRVHSEKELIRDFEKIASALNPERDWSIRIAAMQRNEALVFGGRYLLVIIYHLCPILVLSSIYIWFVNE
jgi:hypothetical protein